MYCVPSHQRRPPQRSPWPPLGVLVHQVDETASPVGPLSPSSAAGIGLGVVGRLLVALWLVQQWEDSLTVGPFACLPRQRVDNWGQIFLALLCTGHPHHLNSPMVPPGTGRSFAPRSYYTDLFDPAQLLQNQCPCPGTFWPYTQSHPFLARHWLCTIGLVDVFALSAVLCNLVESLGCSVQRLTLAREVDDRVHLLGRGRGNFVGPSGLHWLDCSNSSSCVAANFSFRLRRDRPRLRFGSPTSVLVRLFASAWPV
mmetsp:Transcript_1874/g.11247  ORF Transcript_1874/g.11247 Transcript_1874/m.11247 type:complete len:255 (+) Transcript_1874:1830-2594(+)